VTEDRVLAMQYSVALLVNWDNHHGPDWRCGFARESGAPGPMQVAERVAFLLRSLSDAIEQAVLAERKACAEIADRNATCGSSDRAGAWRRWAARMVAREIRARATR
jgi:hypothetical protein